MPASHASPEAAPPRKRGLRRGFTTGACAAAAAKAATLALVGGQPVQDATIHLPIGWDHTFTISRCELNNGTAIAATIKDAGDDPDCTHGAEIIATVSWRDEPGVGIEGGEGVGRITKPGLELPVGEPAINPVPRRMIVEAVGEALGSANARGVQVVISVPGGEEMARKTLNDRLGILGGISILGTKGIVIPYSTAAYKASITQGIDVARANGLDHLVFTTGGRSERFGQKILGLPQEAYVQMGDFVGFSLKEAEAKGARKVTICAMIGKLSKIAKGEMQTHAAGSQVDPVFLAQVAASRGASPEAVEEMSRANTARHFGELVQAHHVDGVFDELCRLVCQRCHDYLARSARRSGQQGSDLALECILTDFNGNVEGRAELRP